MALIANEVERQRAECAGTGLKTLGKWFESGLPTAEDYLEPVSYTHLLELCQRKDDREGRLNALAAGTAHIGLSLIHICFITVLQIALQMLERLPGMSLRDFALCLS